MEIVQELILPLSIAALASLPGLLALRSQNNKRRTESDNLASDAWKELLGPYRQRVQALEDDLKVLRETVENQERRIKRLQEENVALYNGARVLTSQLRAHKLSPVWEFDELSDE